jgi:hypothetical protein
MQWYPQMLDAQAGPAGQGCSNDRAVALGGFTLETEERHATAEPPSKIIE